MQFPRADVPLIFPQQGETGGVLFNRKDPIDANGATVPILDREGKAREAVHAYVMNGGKDLTGQSDRSNGKYRIPRTSVVNRVGDCAVCGTRMTAAQWIWCLNLVCLCVHTTMAFLTVYFAYWSKDLSRFSRDPYDMPIYRVKSVWTNTTTEAFHFSLVETGFSLNIAVLVTTFFLISAFAHLFAVVAGLFEGLWFFYWRQLDDAFVFWRWIEYFASASVMVLLIALSLGIRELNTLILLFVCMGTTQVFGLLTELYSRPVIAKDTTDYKNPVGMLGFVGKPSYAVNERALHLISQDQWEGDTPIEKADGTPADPIDYRKAQRTSNYIRRLVPFYCGWLPFTAVFVVLVVQLEWSRYESIQENSEDMPAWVRAVLYGSFMIFTSFAFVLPIFQWLSPAHYWGSELAYASLSLGSKLFLGLFFMFNVLLTESGFGTDNLL